MQRKVRLPKDGNYGGEALHCLDPNCSATAWADEPTVREGTNGPVLTWAVHCGVGHYFHDFTDLPDFEV